MGWNFRRSSSSTSEFRNINRKRGYKESFGNIENGGTI
jgi:hypothetical protein